MSYSGYYQLLCTQGHYTEIDCYEYDFKVRKFQCSCCGSKLAWWNLVDTTNDAGNPITVEVFIPAIEQQCFECGEVHVTRRARYKVPENIGWRVASTSTDIEHDAKREEDQLQNFEEQHGDHSRLPGD